MSIRRWRIRPPSCTGAGNLDVSSTPGKVERSVQGPTPEKAKASPDLKSLKERPDCRSLASTPGGEEGASAGRLNRQAVVGLDPHRFPLADGTSVEVAPIVVAAGYSFTRRGGDVLKVCLTRKLTAGVSIQSDRHQVSRSNTLHRAKLGGRHSQLG
jgi:hypothetical protein